MPSLRLPFRHFHRIAWLATILTAFTIGFGAFVRLSDAGLSCPDWPTCYGRATWPSAPAEVADHAAARIRPLQTHKAWREQVHRFLAGLLGVEVLSLALLAARRRRFGVAADHRRFGAGGRLAIPLYMQGEETAGQRGGAGRRGDPADRRLALVEHGSGAGGGADPGAGDLAGPAGHVDGDLAAQADRGDGPPAGRAGDLRLPGVDGLARHRYRRCTLADLRRRCAGSCGSGWRCWRCRSPWAAGSVPTTRRWPAAAATPRCPTSRSAWAAGGRRTTSPKASSCGAGSAWTTRAAYSTAARASPSRWRTGSARWR
ncbi:MAG: COX15/CtaA family protein [Pseudomonas sp.]